jgi:hypothetical protein
MRLNVGLLTGGMQTDLATRLIELNDCLAQLYKHAKVSTKDNTFTVDYMAPLSLFTLEENEKTGMMKPNTCHVDGLSKNNSYYYGYAFRYINLRLKYKANLQLKNKPNILGMILENNKPLEPTLKNVPEMYTTIMAKKNLDLIEKIKKIYSADLSKIDHNLSYYPTVIQSLRFCLGAWVYNKYIATQGELEDDGYGSSSEEEHKITNVTIHAKKIAVPFGMRAIAIAHFLQQYLLDQKCTQIVFDQMYYETAELKPTYLVPEKLKKVKRNHEMSFIDGNHFPNSFLARTKPLNLDDTYVVDVTSAGTEQMGEIVYKHIVFLKREFVILVNSMTKNGFAGSDTVGIAMLRIFSNQKKVPESAKSIIEELAQSKASGYANMMRRGYKIEFGGQQNSGILSAASKNTLKQNKTLLGKRNPDSLEKVPSNKKTVCKKALLQKKYT